MFHEFFSYLLSLIYVFFTVFTVYVVLFLEKKQSRIDAVTGAEYSYTQKDLVKYNSLIEKENIIFSIVTIIIFIVLVVTIYGLIRKFWYKNYRRRLYLEIGKRKLFLKIKYYFAMIVMNLELSISII